MLSADLEDLLTKLGTSPWSLTDVTDNVDQEGVVEREWRERRD